MERMLELASNSHPTHIYKHILYYKNTIIFKQLIAFLFLLLLLQLSLSLSSLFIYSTGNPMLQIRIMLPALSSSLSNELLIYKSNGEDCILKWNTLLWSGRSDEMTNTSDQGLISCI